MGSVCSVGIACFSNLTSHIPKFEQESGSLKGVCRACSLKGVCHGVDNVVAKLRYGGFN